MDLFIHSFRDETPIRNQNQWFVFGNLLNIEQIIVYSKYELLNKSCESRIAYRGMGLRIKSFTATTFST